MNSVPEAEVMENLGLKNDRHALRDSSRQVLLLEQETLDGFGLVPGELKENITTSGINLMLLQHRDRIKLGSEAMLEVTKACSPCSRMEDVRSGFMTEVSGRRGMLARVLTGGVIRVQDPIEIISRSNVSLL